MKIDAFIEGNLKISSWGATEVACFCPFHANANTPSFSINRTTGLWVCFNPACNSRGSIRLLADRLGVPHDWAGQQENISNDDLVNEIMGIKEKEQEEEWDDDMERIGLDYTKPSDLSSLQYLVDRGFHPAVLEHFEIGFSSRQNRIVIPARDESYKLLGFIGRDITGEAKSKYLYSKRFPRARMIFNLQNAKQYSTCIVTEGSLDCIKIHQAGFPNVVSMLGANISPHQGELLNKYFNELVLFLDNDAAGEGAIRAIIDICPGKQILLVQYPPGIKDPGEMDEDQIRDTLNNKIDYLSYYYNKGEIK